MISHQAAPTQSMQCLQEAADRLRQSIQALAQKPPGPDRDRAISNAQDALLRTQQAMMALRRDMRLTGMASTADYDKSVKQLMKSADSLRQAIQEMAQQPAGERRNQAIQQAHRALWETQTAMVDAYRPASTQATSGAAGSSSNSGSAASDSPVAMLVLLPLSQAQDQRLAQGCWVRFFDDKGFKGETLTLAGPVDLPKKWNWAMPGGTGTAPSSDRTQPCARSPTRTSVTARRCSAPASPSPTCATASSDGSRR